MILTRPHRRLLRWLTKLRVIALAASLASVVAGCSPPRSARTEPTRTSPVAPTPDETEARAAPRWETVATLSGTSSRRGLPVQILDSAIQWRVRWSCDSGTLDITTTPPSRPAPVMGVRCPGRGEGYSVLTGRVLLEIEASSPWTATVDQQVDLPLDEPLAPETASRHVVAEGSFYPIEKSGSGTARIYGLVDGRRVLRLENFSVTQNTDLFVWLSEAARPTTSAQAVAAPKVVLANLKSTLGNQNYELPAELLTSRIRSVVIWCQPVSIAYAAATLTPA